MSDQLALFMKERQIKIQDILKYSRFGKNYLLSLPLKKKDFLSVVFAGQKKIDKKVDLVNTNVSTIVSVNRK